jgi:hypothetical protein
MYNASGWKVLVGMSQISYVDRLDIFSHLKSVHLFARSS